MLRKKEFNEGNLVWKIILPIGIRDLAFDKWSLNWEGLLIVSQVIPNGAYRLIDTQG